jgi:hypothetical protein
METTIYNPTEIVCASEPTDHKADPSEVAYENAAMALDTEHVAYIYQVHGGRVHFLAACGEEMAQAYHPVTPLAAALPGHPDHQGDGIYWMARDAGGAHVIIRQGNSYKAMIEDDEAFELDREIYEGLPVIDVSEFKPMAWESFSFEKTRSVMRANKILAWAGGVVTAVSLFSVVLLSIVEGVYEGRSQVVSADLNRQANELVSSVRFNQPIHQHLNDIQRIGSALGRTGGWFHRYEVTPEGVSWSVEMPNWVSSEDFKDLGRNPISRPGQTPNTVTISGN